MAESSWPSPSNGRVVDDIGYEKIGQALGPVAGVLGSFTSPQLVYGDSSGMQVKIAADRYALVSGHIWYSGSSIFTKAISANASGSTRTDLVVVRLSRTTWDATVQVITGTPGSGAPAPTQNTGTTGSFDLPLATVTVASGASTVSAGNVTYVGAHLPASGDGYRVVNSAALAFVPVPVAGTTAYDTTALAYWAYTGSAWVVYAVGSTSFYGSGQDATNISVSSTTYAAGSPVVGFSFVAPPSGAVIVTVGGYLYALFNGSDVRLGFEVRTGATVGSGTVVWATSYLRGVTAGAAVTSGGPSRSSGTLTFPIGSLTAGSTYNIRTMHASSVSGSGGNIEFRTLMVQPWFGP